MKVPSTTLLSFPNLSPLLTAGKNIVGYFLDRVVHETSEDKHQQTIQGRLQTNQLNKKGKENRYSTAVNRYITYQQVATCLDMPLQVLCLSPAQSIQNL
jgi:hypothetical protein